MEAELYYRLKDLVNAIDSDENIKNYNSKTYFALNDAEMLLEDIESKAIIVRFDMNEASDQKLFDENGLLVFDMHEAIKVVREQCRKMCLSYAQLATPEQYELGNFEWDNF